MPSRSASTGPTPRRASTECLDRADLEAWLRNPPAREGRWPPSPCRAGPAAGACRTCNLTEDQIDQLVAYLATLK